MARTRSRATDAPAGARRGGAGPGDGPRAGYVLIEAVAALAIALMLLGFTYPLVAPGTTPSC